MSEEELVGLAGILSPHLPRGRFWVEVQFYKQEDMAALNLEKRGIDQSTDVLSFPLLDLRNADLSQSLLEKDIPLGIVVICPEIADEEKFSLLDLLTHGMLHIIGYDHELDPIAWQSVEDNLVSQAAIIGMTIKGIDDVHNN